MAHFDTEYQRLETSYNDSPPGEENLLVHVPEGTKRKFGEGISEHSTMRMDRHLASKNQRDCLLSLSMSIIS